MDKINNTLHEIYNADFLRRRVLELIQDYTSDANNETGERVSDMPQNQFDYMISFCGRSLFGGMDTNNDLLLLCIACVVFCDVSTKFNKIVSLDGFARFVGLPVEYVKTWKTDADAISKKGFYIENFIIELSNLYSTCDCNYYNIINYYQLDSISGVCSSGELLTAVKGVIFSRVHGFRENEIKNGFLSSKQQLGAVALVNREYGWSADTVSQVERARALSLSDLPKLQSYVNPQKQIESLET